MNEHKEALVRQILHKPLEADNVGLINQLKGQANTFDMILDFDSFFEDRIQEDNNDGKMASVTR